MAKRKRSHDDVGGLQGEAFTPKGVTSIANDVSVQRVPNGDATALLPTQQESPTTTIASPLETPNKDEDGWQIAQSKGNKRRKKLPKKDSPNYPSITHSTHARLQSFVKIGDLQNLILYLLADGTSPQWCSVRHSGNFKKVVCLMVPGLESGMFDGKIGLGEGDGERHSATGKEEDASDAEANANDETQDSSEVAPPKTKQDSGDKTSREDIASEFQPVQKIRKRALRISPDDYYPVKLVHHRMPAALRPLSEMFDHIWPIKTPGDDRHARMHSPLSSMLTAPIPRPKEEKKAKGPQFPTEGKNWKDQRTPITEFLATTAELADDGYVLHPAHWGNCADAEAGRLKRVENGQSSEDGWMDIADIPNLAAGKPKDGSAKADPVLQGRTPLAMDCEMCITSPAGVTPQVFSLTRISIVDWDGNVVLDEMVRPADPITDYLTPYSGITPAMLEGVDTTLPDIQRRLQSILTPQTILVGHSLNSDLNALKITHPFIIDTALIFPHPRGPPLKSSLKWLSQKYLGREIQKGHGSTGHNSIEDAKACLDLLKQKCEKGKLWGTSEASGESIFKRLSRARRPRKDKADIDGDDEPRTGAVVDWGEPSRGFGGSASMAIGCQSDADIVTGVKQALRTSDAATNSTQESPGITIPKSGIDFVWARLRELEAYRGWWNRSKSVDNQQLLSSTTTSQTHTSTSLEDAVSQTVAHIREVYDALPACTAFIVYSGSGDPRELSEMQAMQQQFKTEYRVKKWDELSVRWTDDEEQRLRKACEKARRGIGFVAVK